MTSSVPSSPPHEFSSRIRASNVAELDRALRAHEEVSAIFFADWCPFCRDFLRATSASSFPGQLVLVDVSDTDSPLWDRHDVRVIPTVVRFRRSHEVSRIEARRGGGLDESDLMLLADEEPVGEDLQRFEAPGR